MAWLDALTKNRAELRQESSDTDLRPFVVSLPPVHAVPWAEGVISGWPRWQVAASYEERGMIHATHTSRIWRLVDDVHLVFEPDSRGSLVTARSQSRSAKGDFGQNARNLRALVRGLQRADRERLARVAEGAKVNG